VSDRVLEAAHDLISDEGEARLLRERRAIYALHDFTTAWSISLSHST
jgi:hypothetical protein